MPGAESYDVNTPLFTDYATKSRTVWMPSGTHATYRDDGTIDFPVGTVLTKSFGFEGRWFETRVLARHESGWQPMVYVWDETQKHASPAPNGATIAKADGTSYAVPSTAQCTMCHGTTLAPIAATTAMQINRAQPSSGENQLARFVRLGMLDGVPADPPKLAAFSDTSLPSEARARAYLHANCAHCHNPHGLASGTKLYLGVDQTITTDVVPGQPDASQILLRLESTTPGMMMPLVGRTVVHAEAVSVVRDWISTM